MKENNENSKQKSEKELNLRKNAQKKQITSKSRNNNPEFQRTCPKKEKIEFLGVAFCPIGRIVVRFNNSFRTSVEIGIVREVVGNHSPGPTSEPGRMW